MAAPVFQGTRASTTISGATGTLTVVGAVAGEGILIEFRWYTATTITSLVCSGETVELIGSPFVGGPSNARSQYAVIRNVQASGNKAIDITFSATANAGVEGSRISGHDTGAGMVNVTGGAAGTNTTPSVSITTTVNECLGVATVSNNGGDITSPSSGWAITSPSIADPVWFDDRMTAADLGAAGSKTASCTASGASSWGINAIAIAPFSSSTNHDVEGAAAGAGTVAGALKALDPRYGRPSADVSAGGWVPSTGSDLFAMLDESTASDTDYISVASASTCEIRLRGVVDPGSSAGHVVRFRSPAGYTPSGGVVVSLRQGATEIAAWTINPIAANTTYERSLDAGQANAITDYDDLRLRFEAVN